MLLADNAVASRNSIQPHVNASVLQAQLHNVPVCQDSIPALAGVSVLQVLQPNALGFNKWIPAADASVLCLQSEAAAIMSSWTPTGVNAGAVRVPLHATNCKSLIVMHADVYVDLW